MRKPSEYHAAFNPIIFEFDKDTDDIYKDLIINIGGEEIQMRREYINDTVLFDLSPIVSKYFAQKLVDSINPPTQEIFTDPKLIVSYSVGSDTYYAINAVNQIGVNLDYSSYFNKLLTTLPEIRVYSGYPLDVSILCNTPFEMSQGTLNAKTINVVVVDSAGDITRVPQYLHTKGGDEVVTKGGDSIQIGTTTLGKAIDTCVPAQPFYIRWVNFKGGREYYMFSFNQKKTVSLVENQVYQKYIYDNLTENGTDYSYSKRAVEIATVGADSIPTAEYNALVNMTLAPYIEVYLNGKWIKVIIDKSDSVSYTKDATSSFECSFVLPELILQY